MSLGTTSCGAPDCFGNADAVISTAGSAPVAVVPAKPTSLGNRAQSVLVGEGGGKVCTSVEPVQGEASIGTVSGSDLTAQDDTCSLAEHSGGNVVATRWYKSAPVTDAAMRRKRFG